MPRVFLFATIGGALVVITWMAIGYLRRIGRQKAMEIKARSDEQARARLAAQQPGGSADNPIIIHTPSVVEPVAGGLKCTGCGGSVRVMDHQARSVNGRRFRVAVIQCKQCSLEREVFFNLSDTN